MLLRWFGTLIIVLTVAAGIAVTALQTHLSAQARERILKAAVCVGKIMVRNHRDSGSLHTRGSAVVIRADGILATNLHVITIDKTDRFYDEIIFAHVPIDNDANTPQVRYRVKALLIDKERDLVLLRIMSDTEGRPLPAAFALPAIELAAAEQWQVLDDLVIIGFPEKGGATATFSTGIIEGKDLLDEWIKTDARLIRGNSGGAAVNRDGKLIGIPTKVVVDSQRVDKDGDGFPDTVREYGAVGFLRPAYLVAAMLARIEPPAIEENKQAGAEGKETAAERPEIVTPMKLVKVNGLVRSAIDARPIAGARVGLISLGADEVTPENLLTWGGTRADGWFEMNRPVPPGRYTLKSKAIGYEPYSLDIDVVQDGRELVIELRPAQ